MRNQKWMPLIAAVVAGAVVLTGCSMGKKAPATQETANNRPALVIPKEFASEHAKRDFAVKAMGNDYYTEAEPLLADVIKNSPNDAAAYAHMGTVKYMLNQFDAAVAAWSKAAELQPNLAAEMQNNIGNALRDARKMEEAKAAYRKATELDPSRSSAAINLADVLKSEGNLEEAVKVLETALTHSPKETLLADLAAAYKQDVAKTN